MSTGGSDLLDAVRALPENAYVLRLLEEQVAHGGGVVPFVGAGASIPFDMPGWRAFLLVQAQLAGIEPALRAQLAAGEFEESAEALLQARGSTRFHDAIGEAFGDYKLDGKTFTGSAAAWVCQLAPGPLLTTNYDHVLERAAEELGCAVDSIWGAKVDIASEALRSGRRSLLKLHGDVRDRTDRVLTRGDYERQYGNTDATQIDFGLPLPQILDQAFLTRPLLFVGCSLQADRTMQVLQQVAKRHPAVSQFGIVERPAAEADFIPRDRQLSALGIRPVWYPAGRRDLVVAILERLVDVMPAHQRPCGPSPQVTSGATRRWFHTRPLDGRATEVAQILAFLNTNRGLAAATVSEAYAIVGAPGIGKSSVCTTALREYLLTHPTDRVYFVDVAEARNEALLRARLADALGMSEELDASALASHLLNSGAVVYFDNVEDVLGDPSAVVFLETLVGVLGVRILASSRETLPGFARSVPLGPLAPDSAVTLFRREHERAGGRQLDDTPLLRTFLANDLGHHPLSIVLVAAQAPTYGSIEALQSGWRDDALSLAASARGPHTPLSSLEVSLERSLRIVLAEEPAAVKLWALLAVFPDGLSPHAFESMFRTDPAARRAGSLLARLHLAEVDTNGTWRMLPPLRRFIVARMRRWDMQDRADAPGLVGWLVLSLRRLLLALRRQSAKRRQTVPITFNELLKVSYPYFSSIVHAAQEHLHDELRTVTLLALKEEFGNLHAFFTLTWPLHFEWAVAMTGLGVELGNFFQSRAILGEEILRYLLALQPFPMGYRREWRADLLVRLAELEVRSRPEQARRHYQQALQLWPAIGAQLGQAYSHGGLGDVERTQGRPEEARQHYERALKMHRAKADELGEANTLHYLGDTEVGLGRMDVARRHYEKALQLYQVIGDRLGEANTLTCFGGLEVALHQIEEGRARLMQALSLHRAESDQYGEALTLRILGFLDVIDGKLDDARVNFSEAKRLAIVEMDPRGIMDAWIGLAAIADKTGASDARSQALSEAHEVARHSGIPRLMLRMETIETTLDDIAQVSTTDPSDVDDSGNPRLGRRS